MNKNKMKALALVLGLSLSLFVGCKPDQPNPGNPTTPSQETGEKILDENKNTNNEGSVGFNFNF